MLRQRAVTVTMTTAGSYDNSYGIDKKRTLATTRLRGTRRDEGEVDVVEFTKSVEKKVDTTIKRAGPLPERLSGMWRCAKAKPKAV